MQAFFYPFTFHSLEFDTIPIDAYSSAGTKYTRLIRFGMPKLPEELLNLAFYLYKTKANAKKGVKIGGTGFYIGVPSKRHSHTYIYGITNWHVAIDGKASVIRVNMIDGTTDTFDYNPSDWVSIRGGGDIAISPILELKEGHASTYMEVKNFATNQIISEKRINIGDDVFMVGRFIDHDGGPTNIPAVRCGNISVMPTYISDEPNNRDGKSYCIDMHSRTGYSGSPVIVYRTLGGDLTNYPNLTISSRQQFQYLLGIHWGQFHEYLKDQKRRKIKGLSGMTCVTPAEKIIDLINLPQLKAERDRRDAEIEEHYQKYGYPPTPET